MSIPNLPRKARITVDGAVHHNMSEIEGSSICGVTVTIQSGKAPGGQGHDQPKGGKGGKKK